LQIDIARQASKTIKDCRNSNQLTTSEIDYLQKVFNNLLDDCSKRLDALFNIISNGELLMKDDERIAAIDKLYEDMVDKQTFIRSFCNTSRGLCVQRENDRRNIIISKKVKWSTMKTITLFLCLAFSTSWINVTAQSAEAQQLLLNVEKLAQFKKILSNMKKGYEVVSKGYNNIKDISKGNFNLHDAFLNALLQVSPAVKKYKRIGDIVICQSQIIKEYRAAFNRFKVSNLFTASETKYMEQVYDNLFNKSLQNLNELTIVITAGKLRMSDDERICCY